MKLKVIALAMLSVFLSLPAFAQAPAGQPTTAGKNPAPKAGFNETILSAVAQRDQASGAWEGAVNIAMGTYTGDTTEAGLATTFFSFGPASGVGAGGFVEQTFWDSGSGALYGSANLLANGGSAAQASDGTGAASIGYKVRRGNLTGRLALYVQRAVGLKGTADPVQTDSLDQIGFTIGIGFGRAATP